MSVSSLLVVAIGLSMDAFAVSISKGLAMRAFRLKQALAIALCFELFQAIMPLIGYFIGSQFSNLIASWDHWLAFALLALIGVNMLREAFGEEEAVSSFIDLKTLCTLGIATSIDALAIGISFALLNVPIFTAVSLIGAVTFIFCLIGVKSGHFLGSKFKSKAEIFGGLVLLAMAFKILCEHGVFA